MGFLIIACMLANDFHVFVFFHERYLREMDDYQVLCTYLRHRILPTLFNIRVVSYSIVSVLIIGGAGIWMPWLSSNTTSELLPGSTVFTYVFALLGSLVCNKLFFYSSRSSINTSVPHEAKGHTSQSKDADEHENNAVLSAWGILAGSIVLIMTSVVYAKNYDDTSLLGVLSLILSWVLYYAATAWEVKEKTSTILKGAEDAEALFPFKESSETFFNAEFFQSGGNPN